MKKTLFFLAAALTFSLAANAQSVFSEDFSNVTTGSNGLGSIPEGWVLYEDDLTNYSDYTAFGKSWCVGKLDDVTKMALSTSYTTTGAACDRWLVTPQITIPATGAYGLLFNLLGLSDSYPESLKVLVSTSGTEKANFTHTILDLSAVPSGINTRFINLEEFADQSIHIAFVNYGANGYYVGVGNLDVTILPENSMELTGVSAAPYATQDTEFPVSVTVYNTGSQPLTSFDINYTLNNDDVQTINVTDVNVASFGSYVHNFPISYNTLGNLTINVAITNPNGVQNAEDADTTGTATVNIYDPALYAPNRVALLEHFTTARCPNCPPAHVTLENAIEPIENNVAWVAHHVGYYTDNMTITESNEMMAFYNNNGRTYAPAVMIDRNNEFATTDDPGPIFFPSAGYVDEQLLTATSTPAMVSVNISDINYNEMTRELSVKVSGTFFSDITFGSARVSLYVTQDSIMGSQSGAQGTYRHDHVIRACISDVWGDQNVITTSTANSTFEKTFTYQLPYNINAQKARLVAFVNNYASNVNDRKVYNATKSEYLLNHTDPTLGINSVEASINVVTYPNPATEMAYVTAEGTIRAYEMVDALGRKVMSQENVNADILELNVSSFSAGVYFISITTDKGVATQRLTIVK